MARFDYEDRFRKSATKPELAKQHLRVAPLVEIETAGENDVFASIEDDLPSLPLAPEGEQLLVKTTPTTLDTVPLNTTVNSRGRTRKVSS